MLKGRSWHETAALREEKYRQRRKEARKPPSGCPHPVGAGGGDEPGKALKGATQGHLVLDQGWVKVPYAAELDECCEEVTADF